MTPSPISGDPRVLDALLKNASVAIFMMDAQFQCVYMNPAAEQLSGFTLPEMRGRTLHDVMHHTRPDGRHFPIDECPIGLSLADQDRVQGEEVFVHKDGSFYAVGYAASPVRDDTGELIGTILEVRDIRREKAALQGLQEANRAKDEFLAMLGHELRNPLAPIATCLQLLQRKGVTARELDVIARQVGHLTRLVDDLLDVARVTRGLAELKPEPTTLGDVVQRSIEIVRPLLEQRQQPLVVELPEPGIRLLADVNRLAQVLSNLLSNASKFSPVRSPVRLRCRRGHDGQVCIRVEDEGRGIEAQALERIFEPFVQSEQGRDRAMGGLGLGLAIARTFARQHGGDVQAHSDGPGHGATFAVTLPEAPSVPADAPAQGPAAAGAPAAAAVPGMDILIVDDNRDGARSMQALLALHGHRVRAAFDAATAMQAVETRRPDLVLLDIGLPVLDGYELAARMRQALANAPPRFVALTGYALPSDVRHSAAEGFEAHLVKPVEPAALLAALGGIPPAR